MDWFTFAWNNQFNAFNNFWTPIFTLGSGIIIFLTLKATNKQIEENKNQFNKELEIAKKQQVDISITEKLHFYNQSLLKLVENFNGIDFEGRKGLQAWLHYCEKFEDPTLKFYEIQHHSNEPFTKILTFYFAEYNSICRQILELNEKDIKSSENEDFYFEIISKLLITYDMIFGNIKFVPNDDNQKLFYNILRMIDAGSFNNDKLADINSKTQPSPL